jgi:hypothetical protein
LVDSSESTISRILKKSEEILGGEITQPMLNDTNL